MRLGLKLKAMFGLVFLVAIAVRLIKLAAIVGVIVLGIYLAKQANII